MSSKSKNYITFERKDEITQPGFNQAVIDVASHFKSRRSYFGSFVKFINTSHGWRIINIQDKLKKWCVIFTRLGANSEIIEIVVNAFGLCENQDDINYLRGLLLEAVIIACHGGPEILENKGQYGWGARIDIHNGIDIKKVRYDCPLPQSNECLVKPSKTTVDFVDWNGYHGKLYECKVAPTSIRCVDREYLKHLKSQLKNESVSHEIYFVCAADKDEIEMILREHDLPPTYKAYGTRELQSMIA